MPGCEGQGSIFQIYIKNDAQNKAWLKLTKQYTNKFEENMFFNMQIWDATIVSV